MSKNNNKKRPQNNNQPKVLIPPTDETNEILTKEAEIEKNEDVIVKEKAETVTVENEEKQPVIDENINDIVENENKIEEAQLIDVNDKIDKVESSNKATIIKEKNIVKKEVDKKTPVAAYTVYASKNGSPLQNAKIIARLKSLNISYEIIDNDIKLKTCNTLDDAIVYRKFIAGKGLKPIIV